ncbi:hypothetical protein KEM54_001970 [Ascosphaera aggregata]|nr:hypothetical protein KEM54_001970 [Ascosphaera aggregata]
MLSSLFRRILHKFAAATAAVPTLPQRAAKKNVTSVRKGLHFNISTFQEGDIVMVHGKRSMITSPLKLDGKMRLQRGFIPHNDIIGKRVRDAVNSNQDVVYRLSYPTLEQYATLTPRLVTPVGTAPQDIYPADANLIVSLLDIHVSPPPGDGNDIPAKPLEILEAGTGHGSLTLHLARAINAANPPPPCLPPRQTPESKRTKTTELQESHTSHLQQLDPDLKQQLAHWRARRGAILHTVDISPAYSMHAETIVRGFRRGIYAGNVDFYTSPVENWIEDQMDQRRQRQQLDESSKGEEEEEEEMAFLQYAILDMPAAHERIPHVSRILNVDGILAVFMPSVTQIGDCVQLINKLRLPLMLEKAVELGTGLSSGRIWDVRTAMVRRPKPAAIYTKPTSSNEGDADEEAKGDEPSTDAKIESEHDVARTERQPVLVCRPKVGDKIVGGGFVGIWRKIRLERLDEK